MIDAEKKLAELKKELDQMDTNPIHGRVEARLHTAWKNAQTKDSKTRPWRWWTVALSTSGVVALALISTTLISPEATPKTPKSTLTSQTQDKDSLALGSATLGAADVSGFSSPSIIDDEIEPLEYEVLTGEEYSYTEGQSNLQLLKESVSLSVDVQDDMLDVIHQLREQLKTQGGYLINIYYYDTRGTVDMKLPADQLATFEEFLKKIDVDHSLVIDNYNITNVSQEIVTIDEQISSTQEKIEADKAALASDKLSAWEKQEIQNEIIANEEYIRIKTTERSETIAEYGLVNVRVTLNEFSSFFEGNYTQYDRSTFSGMVKYELGRALYYVIRSSSDVIRFVLWLAIYSVLYIPGFFIIRTIFRKVRRHLKKS